MSYVHSPPPPKKKKIALLSFLAAILNFCLKYRKTSILKMMQHCCDGWPLSQKKLFIPVGFLHSCQQVDRSIASSPICSRHQVITLTSYCLRAALQRNRLGNQSFHGLVTCSRPTIYSFFQLLGQISVDMPQENGNDVNGESEPYIASVCQTH